MIIAPQNELNFYHQDHCRIQKQNLSAFDVYLLMTEPNRFLNFCFYLRDVFSRLGGVKAIYGFCEPRPTQPPKPNEKLDFFDVVKNDKNELCLTAIDRHLSVMLHIGLYLEEHVTNIVVTTSVKTHEWFGRLYMQPVSKAHGMIVHHMLKNVKAQTAQNKGN